MGYADYFLIVADFIDWARQASIPVGPGRGSGAGSLVAYALGITQLDPIRYGLLFERFLNPERVSLPDFDIDFCMLGRDRVIEYVVDRYGADKVAQIITFNSWLPGPWCATSGGSWDCRTGSVMCWQNWCLLRWG